MEVEASSTVAPQENTVCGMDDVIIPLASENAVVVGPHLDREYFGYQTIAVCLPEHLLTDRRRHILVCHSLHLICGAASCAG